MSSVNKATILGNLGNDPEARSMPNGGEVVTISVATSERWNDKKSGEKKEKTEWHRVTFFGKLAEIAGRYLRKGSKVYVEGRIETQKWQDQQGNDRYSTQIVAKEMKMLGGESRNESKPPPQDQRVPDSEGFSDDVPF